jgi:hypothetical protein
MKRSPHRIACAALIASLAGLSACAGAKTHVVHTGETAGLERPSKVLVYNFAVDPDDVVVDSLGPNFMHGGSSDPDEQRKLGVQVSDALAANLVKRLNEKNISAERANPATQAPLHALLIKGQFLTINEGDQAARVSVGFGAGTEELRVQAQVYVQTENGPRQLRQSFGEAHGDKMPGMAVPVGAGAAAGRAASSAVISGGMNAASELTGGLEEDTDNLAKDFADRAAAFYSERGW